MRKRGLSKHAGIIVASATTAIVLILLFIVPSTVFGIDVTMSPTKGDGATYLLGETLLFQGAISLAQGEFQDVQSVSFRLTGPQSITVFLPIDAGEYDRSAQLPDGKFLVTVVHQNLIASPVGSGYANGFKGGVGGGSLLYTISYTPPAYAGYLGPYQGHLRAVTSPGGTIESLPTSFSILRPFPTPTPTPTRIPPGEQVIVEPTSPSGVGSVVRPGTNETMTSPDGSMSLFVPATFLDESVQIVLDEVAPADVPPAQPGKRVLRAISINVYDLLGNHQTVVSGTPVTLKIAYTDADVAAVGGDPSNLVIMRYVESQNQWITLNTTVDTQNKVLITTLNTFSTFAIGSEVRLGDINTDGVVNYVDLAMFAASYGSAQGEALYRRTADLNSDGRIDVVDLGIFAANYGM